jgi:hypothetical protein
VRNDGSAEGNNDSSPGGFVQIERAFLRDTSLTKEERWAGIMLASYEGKRGIAFPGKRLLRIITGLGMVKLEEALAVLAKKKYLEHVQSRAPRGRFGGSVEYKTHGILHPRKDAGSGDSQTSLAGSKHAGSNRLHGSDGHGREPPKMRG